MESIDLKVLEEAIREMKHSDDALNVYIRGINDAKKYFHYFDVNDNIGYCPRDELIYEFTRELINIYDERILTSEFYDTLEDKLKKMSNLDSKIDTKFILQSIMKHKNFHNHPILWDFLYKYTDVSLNFNFLIFDNPQNLACRRALHNYVLLNREVDELRRELAVKNKEIDNLKNIIEHYKYSPGGEGYYESKINFEKLSQL